MYHYLTGAASWFMMTMITQAFGVRGEAGDLLLAPKLTAEQFDEQGRASLSLVFAGKKLEIVYENEGMKEYGDYTVGFASCSGAELQIKDSCCAVIRRSMLETLSDECHRVTVKLI